MTLSPTPSPTITEDIVERAEQSCRSGSDLCRVVIDVTGSTTAGTWTEVLVGTPFAVVMILVIAFLARFLIHRVIGRVTERVAVGEGLGPLRSGRYASVLEHSPLSSQRRTQRARTVGSVLRSLATGVIATIALVMVMAELGLNIAPLLASAGIIGVALGFGAQALVRDFLSGLFMFVEDQYGVGDMIDVGTASGVVEGVGLRITRLRALDGTLWYLPNGRITQVGNQSQGWARVVLDVAVGYDQDIAQVEGVLEEVAREVAADPQWSDRITEEPQVWGIESLAADTVVIRVVARTAASQQWVVARELRRRVKEAFDAAGIQATTQQEDEPPATPAGPGLPPPTATPPIT